MNTIIRTAMLVVAIVMTSATIALAETIYYLKIEKNGVLVKNVPVASDGSFTIGVLPEGAYSVSVVNAQGKILDLTGTIDIVTSPPANARRSTVTQPKTTGQSRMDIRGPRSVSFTVEPGGGVMNGAINTSKSNIKNN
jgi:hypothetical protein